MQTIPENSYTERAFKFKNHNHDDIIVILFSDHKFSDLRSICRSLQKQGRGHPSMQRGKGGSGDMQELRYSKRLEVSFKNHNRTF